jgi:hypothetical protein
MTGTDGVADAGQEVGYWISEVHSFSFIPRSLDICLMPRTCGDVCFGWNVQTSAP